MNIYSFISGIAFMLYISFGISAYKKLGNTSSSISFLLLSISLSLYSLGYLFTFDSSTYEWTRFWYIVAIFGCILFPLFLLLLSLILSRPNKKPNPLTLLLISIPTMFFIIVNFVDPTFYAVDFRQIELFDKVIQFPNIDSSRPITILFLTYIIAYTFSGLLLIQIWGYRANSKRIKRIAKVILLSSVFTFVLSIFTNIIASNLKIPLVSNLAHINILLTYFAYYYSIQVYQFLTPSPHIAITNIMKSAREIIIITNSANKIISINQHSLNLLEYNSAEIHSIDIHDILVHDKQRLSGTLVTEADNNDRVEAELITRSGKKIPVSITTAKIFDEFDELIARVFIGTDITNHVKISELLTQKEKLISIIAHDLRNPIGVALNISQELSNETILDKEESKTLYEIQQSSLQRSLSLLENLLLWARIDDVDNFFSPAKIDLHEAVVTSIHFLNANIKAKELKVENKVPIGLEVYADSNMINTVIRNLLSNAIKFTPQKGNIVIKPISNNQSKGIAVIDNGIGIDDEHLKSIFEIKKKVSRDSSGGSGTGLGLVICKEFIEKNNGSIWVKSRLGKGSEFSIELPVNKE